MAQRWSRITHDPRILAAHDGRLRRELPGGRSVTECQGCGAWNDTSRTLCVLCGTPLAETDEWDAAAELPPLPPLPDGGLAASMPTWLREAPSLSPPEPPLIPTQEPELLGPRADPRTFLSDDDFPRWLHDLAARRDETARPAAVRSVPLSASWSGWPKSANPVPAAAIPAPPAGEAEMATAVKTPAPISQTSLAMVAANTVRGRRERGAWETLLLVFLFIGLIVVALWSLVANGVFSPGL